MAKVPLSMFIKGGASARSGKDLFKDWDAFTKGASRTSDADIEVLKTNEQGITRFIMDQASQLMDPSQWDSFSLKESAQQYLNQNEQPNSPESLAQELGNSPTATHLKSLKLMGEALNQLEQDPADSLQSFKKSNTLAPVDTIQKYHDVISKSVSHLSQIWNDNLPTDQAASLSDIGDLKKTVNPQNYIDLAHKQNSELLSSQIHSPQKLGELMQTASPAELSHYPREMASIQASPAAIENPVVGQKSEAGIAMHLSKSLDNKDLAPSLKGTLLEVTKEVGKTLALGVITGGLSIKSKLAMEAIELVADKALDKGFDKLSEKFNGAMKDANQNLDKAEMNELSSQLNQALPQGQPNSEHPYKDMLSKLREDVNFSLNNPGIALQNTPSQMPVKGPRIQR